MRRRLAGLLGAVISLACLAAARPARAETDPSTPPPSGGVAQDRQYSEIQAAFLREDFDRVIRLVRPPNAGISVEPRSTQVWLWYVLSLDRLHRTSESLYELDRLHAFLAGAPAEDQRQAWPEALFWDGEISRRGRKMVRARLAYQRLLTTFPDSSWRPQAHRGLGLVLFDQQLYDAALQQFHEAAGKTTPTSMLGREMILLQGLCNIRLKRFEDGLARFRDLLAQDPPPEPSVRARVTFYLAEALTGLRRFGEALQAYQKVIDTDRASRWAGLARFGLGWGYFQQGDCQKSLGAFRGYRASAPFNGWEGAAADLPDAQVEMLFAEGRCLMELGDEAEALARFERVRAFDPEHDLAIDAALGMAELFERRQQLDQAMAILDAVFRQAFDPLQVARANVQAGSVSLAQGDPIRATTHFLMARDSADPAVRQGALNGLGDAYGVLGNFEEAARSYEESLRVDAGSAAGLYAMYQLGRLKLQIGKSEEAIALFRRLMEQPARSDGSGGSDRAARTLAAEARLAFAFALLSQAQPEVARRELQALRAQDPTSPQAARAGYYLALLAAHEGKTAEAATLCESVIRQAPRSDEALEAQLLLADLAASAASPQEALAQLLGSLGGLSDIPDRHRGRFAKKIGDLARQVQRFSEAIHWYEAAWEAWPAARGELEYRMASCYEEGGDAAMAAQRYRAITRAPWGIRGQLAAAKLMERDQRWQDAIAIYEALTRQPVPEAKIAQERLTALSRIAPTRTDVRRR